jgi:uracil-DNA glycosylase family 4
MTLQLDARQRAMLEEMGVRVFAPWTPPAAAASVPDAVASDSSARLEAPVQAERPLPATREPVPRTVPAQLSAGARERIPGIAGMDWDALRSAVAACEACKLCAGRRNTVFGVGDLQADWLVVGEAPGENEDLQGEPFVGQAGKLLDNMLGALGVSRRRQVYIANVLKCRPPGNRNPEPEEIAQCEPFLRRQVELLRPRIILAMGRFAVQTLLQTTEPIGRLRGRVHRYQEVPVVVTYHPAYLLRNLPDKAKAWADLCLAQAVLRGEA